MSAGLELGRIIVYKNGKRYHPHVLYDCALVEVLHDDSCYYVHVWNGALVINFDGFTSGMHAIPTVLRAFKNQSFNIQFSNPLDSEVRLLKLKEAKSIRVKLFKTNGRSVIFEPIHFCDIDFAGNWDQFTNEDGIKAAYRNSTRIDVHNRIVQRNGRVDSPGFGYKYTDDDEADGVYVSTPLTHDSDSETSTGTDVYEFPSAQPVVVDLTEEQEDADFNLRIRKQKMQKNSSPLPRALTESVIDPDIIELPVTPDQSTAESLTDVVVMRVPPFESKKRCPCGDKAHDDFFPEVYAGYWDGVHHHCASVLAKLPEKSPDEHFAPRELFPKSPMATKEEVKDFYKGVHTGFPDDPKPGNFCTATTFPSVAQAMAAPKYNEKKDPPFPHYGLMDKHAHLTSKTLSDLFVIYRSTVESAGYTVGFTCAEFSEKLVGIIEGLARSCGPNDCL